MYGYSVSNNRFNRVVQRYAVWLHRPQIGHTTGNTHVIRNISKYILQSEPCGVEEAFATTGISCCGWKLGDDAMASSVVPAAVGDSDSIKASS